MNLSDRALDIHYGNLMFRMVSVGPQLVITDPLYAGSGNRIKREKNNELK
jgi:hypothetical protein